MKKLLFCIAILSAACNDTEKQTETTTTNHDTVQVQPADTSTAIKPQAPVVKQPEQKIYSNARFKDVTVERKADHRFLIKGKAQIFEANFSWVVEDGHNELKKGFEMTDAGAPEWGNFSFSIEVAKQRENSTLMLILFESSAKDGSRQHELPIVLY